MPAVSLVFAERLHAINYIGHKVDVALETVRSPNTLLSL
jgi:hypothetical protein